MWGAALTLILLIAALAFFAAVLARLIAPKRS